jgi:plastocyanin
MRTATILGILGGLAAVSFQPTGSAGAQMPNGTIEGRVTFQGSPPPPTIGEGGPQPVLYIDRAGGLRYAVVFLADEQANATPVSRTATMGQRNFIFEPQVLAVRTGETVRFTNDDPANHNVRAQDANPGNTFNINTASGSLDPNTHQFISTHGRPVQLFCDIHPWMTAWIYVFDHDQFAVTNADGNFRIENVPVGHSTIAIRQPAGGLVRDLAVDIRPAATTRVEVRFAPADVAMPAR